MGEEEYGNDFILFCESNDIYSEYEKDVAWLSWNHQQQKIDTLEKELEMRKQGVMIMSHHRDEVLRLCDDRRGEVHWRLMHLLKRSRSYSNES